MKKMKKTDSRKMIYRMVEVALFASLCFLGTYISIPFGISKVHLGNFICILGGFLLGGLVGGLSGAIGMGLNDLVSSYGPDTILRTVIVKFVMGYLAGVLLRLCLKKKVWKGLFVLSEGGFITAFVALLTLYVLYGESFEILGRKFSNSMFLIVCLGVFVCLNGAMLILSFFIRKDRQWILLCASFVASVNILLEFLLKIPFKMLMASMTFEQAYAYAITSLPSALMTAIVTTLLITLAFYPIYFATRRVNRFDDLHLTLGREEPKN